MSPIQYDIIFLNQLNNTYRKLLILNAANLGNAITGRGKVVTSYSQAFNLPTPSAQAQKSLLALPQNALNYLLGKNQTPIRESSRSVVGPPYEPEDNFSGKPIPTGDNAMASNIYKVTWNFIESSGATFSEVYYRNASTALNAVSFSVSTVNARCRLLHPSIILRSIRAFNVAGGRDSYIAILNYPGNYPDPNNLGPAAAGSAAVCSFATATGKNVYHWLRGLAAAAVQSFPGNGFPNPPPVLANNIKAFAQNLGGDAAGTRALNNVTNGKYAITALATGTTPQTSVLTYTLQAGQPLPNWQNGSRVIISGTSKKDLPALNGHWSIISASTPSGVPLTGTVTLRYVIPNNALSAAAPGFIRTENYGAVNFYTGGALSYYGTHSTRSVFSNSRGAKRVQRLRTLA